MTLRGILTVMSSLALGAVACADWERGPRAVEEDETPNDGNGSGNDNDNGGDALSFATDVYPLLRSGCEAGCHVGGGSASSTGYVINGDEDSDYMNTLLFINEGSPGTSRLLTKGAGQSHGGGSIYANDSSEFATILNWIQTGALP